MDENKPILRDNKNIIKLVMSQKISLIIMSIMTFIFCPYGITNESMFFWQIFFVLSFFPILGLTIGVIVAVQNNNTGFLRISLILIIIVSIATIWYFFLTIPTLIITIISYHFYRQSKKPESHYEQEIKGDKLNKKNILRICIVIIIIAVLIIASLYMVVFQNTNGITAFKAKAIANRVALDWNPSAKLHSLSPNIDEDILSNSGRFFTWELNYFSNVITLPNGSYNFDWKSITVTKEGAIRSSPESNIWSDTEPNEILNWDVNSPEAFSIVQSNETVMQYLNEEGTNYTIDGMVLIGTPNNSSMWLMSWVDDTRHLILLSLNAESGKIVKFNYIDTSTIFP